MTKTLLLGGAWLGLCVGLTYLNAELLSVGLFSLLFLGIRVGLVPQLSTAYVAAYRDKAMELSTHESRLLWCNTAVSLVHSCLSSAMSLSVLIATPFEDWIHSCNTLAVMCLALSTGYFIYDLYDMVVGDLYVRAVGILVHHVMVITCYVLALYYKVAVPYLVAMLLLEINSVCLHARKLMSMVGFTLNDRVYVVAWQALWLTFYTTRMILTIGVQAGVYFDYDRFPHISQFLVAFIGTSILHVLNYLVYQGCRKAYKKELAAISKKQS